MGAPYHPKASPPLTIAVTAASSSTLSPIAADALDPLPGSQTKGCGKSFYGGNVEALGFALDAIGRSVAFVTVAAFLANVLLRLAKEAAGCQVDPLPGETQVPECKERLYGILRPSSLLTAYSIVVGMFSAALLPLMGAIVDYTSIRLKMGQVTSVLLCVFLLPQIFLSDKTWLAIAILSMINAFIGWMQTMVTYAYIPELTDDEALLNKWTSNFTVCQFSSMLAFLLIVLGIAQVAGLSDDDIAVAQLGQSIAFVISSVTLYLAWGRLLKPRPAAHDLPEGTSVWSAGFRQLYRTSKTIMKDYKALKWFYLGVAFSDAGGGALLTIFVTYATDTLAFTSTESGISVVAMLLGGVPGAVAARVYTERFHNPIHSVILSTILVSIVTIISATILTEAGQQLRGYGVAVALGFGMGWKNVSDKLLSSTLIPSGQDAELMGVYLFAGQVLSWLPPLCFTGLNELGVSQRIGFASVFVWFLLGGTCYYLVGDYQNARKVAKEGGAPNSEVEQIESSAQTEDDIHTL